VVPVVAISEAKPGAPDHEVLDLAAAEGRIVLTFDQDFGSSAGTLDGSDTV